MGGGGGGDIHLPELNVREDRMTKRRRRREIQTGDPAVSTTGDTLGREGNALRMDA